MSLLSQPRGDLTNAARSVTGIRAPLPCVASNRSRIGSRDTVSVERRAIAE